MNDQERIEYFMAEIARLSNQVVDLQNERDDLAATVNTLKMAIMSNCYDDPSTSGKRLMELANATPQQHLAQIRAKAGRAGYMRCVKDFNLTRSYCNGWAPYQMADSYENEIQHGGEV